MRDMTTADLAKDWTDAELAALSRGSSMWNPWAKIWMETKDPRADTLAAVWSYIHDGRYCTGIDDPNTADPLDALLQEGALKQAGVRVVRHPESRQAIAVFPNVPARPTRKYELAWESRGEAMHNAQTTIDVADLPERGMEADQKSSRPTFHSTMTESEPPKA
jgi:hypothetical protein